MSVNLAATAFHCMFDGSDPSRRRPSAASAEEAAVAPQGDHGEPRPDGAELDASPGRILVVDDHDAVRALLRRFLETRGHETAVASSGDRAQALLAGGAFDAVVTDIHMPGSSGMSLLRHVRSTYPGLPVVLITGAPNVNTAIEAVQRGAFAYLTKPFDAEQFLAVMDRAVRMSRLARRNAVVGQAMDLLDSGSHLGVDARFDRALASLWMAYQPIVRASDGSPFAYEALVRTREPGLENPGALLSTAEMLDRVIDVGRVVRRRVAAAIDAGQVPGAVFVNLHPQELEDDDLFDKTAPLSQHADRVVLEITERSSLDNVSQLKARVDRLRELGYWIAIDDLGAGYASLSWFVELFPDYVKLDMGLVRGIDADPTRARLIRFMIDLCVEMGAPVVGEGVETGEERRVLGDLGCHLIQGYLIGRPAPLPGV